MKNRIGIQTTKAKELAAHLNDLLADYQIHYQNLRGFHWNIQGPQFFELHVKFEELYTAAQVSIDEIAERILTLGETPRHTFADYLASASIPVHKDVTDAQGTVEGTLAGLTILLSKEREILGLASEAGDEGTVDLMTGYISIQEKTTWMLSAYLGQ